MTYLEITTTQLKKKVTEELDDSVDSKFLEFLMKEVTKSLGSWSSYDIDYNIQKKLYKAIKGSLSEIEE